VVQTRRSDHSLTRIDSPRPCTWTKKKPHPAPLERGEVRRAPRDADATIEIDCTALGHEAHSNPEFWSKTRIVEGNVGKFTVSARDPPQNRTRSNHSYILTASSPMR